MKRRFFFLFLLTATILFLSVGGCGKGTMIPFAVDGASQFTIVRSNEADQTVCRMAVALSETLSASCGAEIPVKNDMIKQDEDDYEILLGVCERPQSQKAYDEILTVRENNFSDYIIRMDGKKAVIVGKNLTGLQAAVERFTADCQNGIPSDYRVIFREKKTELKIGGASVGKYVIRTEKYPSYWAVSAAEDLRQFIIRETGYEIPVETDVNKTEYEIQIGPMTERAADGNGLEKCDYAAYRVYLSDHTLIVNGGSTYAANIATQELIGAFGQKNKLAADFRLEGKYTSGSYGLSGGYDLTFNEDFDYTTESEVKAHWTISSDTTNGPTVLKKTTDADGNEVITYDEQRRPGIWHENYWTENGLLYEVTKKEPYGYSAVRLTTRDKMNFQYGILEVRMKMATANGACSSVWMSCDGIKHTVTEEIDVYENYGRDSFHAQIHSRDRSDPDHTVHKQYIKNSTVVTPAEGEHFYDTFHYIGMEWTDRYIHFLLDGQIFESVEAGVNITEEAFDYFRQTIMLKLANGVGTGTYTASNPETFMSDVSQFHETQVIDFVRIFQKKNDGSQMILF